MPEERRLRGYDGLAIHLMNLQLLVHAYRPGVKSFFVGLLTLARDTGI